MNGISPILIQSFAENRGSRGVHFYDSKKAEFLSWNETMKAIESNFPKAFAEKLLEAMANYSPESEFVTVCAGGGQLTIEVFKAETY